MSDKVESTHALHTITKTALGHRAGIMHISAPLAFAHSWQPSLTAACEDSEATRALYRAQETPTLLSGWCRSRVDWIFASATTRGWVMDEYAILGGDGVSGHEEKMAGAVRGRLRSAAHYARCWRVVCSPVYRRAETGRYLIHNASKTHNTRFSSA